MHKLQLSAHKVPKVLFTNTWYILNNCFINLNLEFLYHCRMVLIMQSQELLHYLFLNKYLSTPYLPGTVLGSEHSGEEEILYFI